MTKELLQRIERLEEEVEMLKRHAMRPVTAEIRYTHET